MVRVNLINPEYLSDQHLRAEHVEILMLLSSSKKVIYENIPKTFCLGKGHINFFKNKIRYLERRFFAIQSEMRERGMNVKAKLPDLKQLKNCLQYNDYYPDEDALNIIKTRILERIRKKPEWYSYHGDKYEYDLWEEMINNAIV